MSWENAEVASARAGHPTYSMGLFINQPRLRLLAGIVLPWMIAVFVGSTIAACIPDPERFKEGAAVSLTNADRFTLFWQWCIFLSILVAPVLMLVVVPMMLAFSTLAKRFALICHGWPLATVFATAGALINMLMFMLLQYISFENDEHHLALCQQWEGPNSGTWLADDPRCGMKAWDWIFAIIPGASASLVYWFIIYRPSRTHVATKHDPHAASPT